MIIRAIAARSMMYRWNGGEFLRLPDSIVWDSRDSRYNSVCWTTNLYVYQGSYSVCWMARDGNGWNLTGKVNFWP